MSQTFIKSHTELIEFGVPKTMALLYGVIEFMAARNGECWPTHKTLGEKCGLKSTRQVIRLLEGLRRFKLIEWTRGRYFNRYRPLMPDVTWMSHLLANPDMTPMSDLSGHEGHISDVTRMSYRKEPAREKKNRKEKASQPASCLHVTGGLAGLLTEAWKHLDGSPGEKLLAQIADALGDVPLEQFHAFLVSCRTKPRGFGLALELARELSQRWKSDAVDRKRSAEAAAEDQRQIRLFENLLADANTPPENRPELEQWLRDLRDRNDAKGGA